MSNLVFFKPFLQRLEDDLLVAERSTRHHIVSTKSTASVTPVSCFWIRSSAFTTAWLGSRQDLLPRRQLHDSSDKLSLINCWIFNLLSAALCQTLDLHVTGPGVARHLPRPAALESSQHT